MTSYGPSMILTRELCENGRWGVVADYLKDCKSFWSNKSIDGWIDDVENERMPTFEPEWG